MGNLYEYSAFDDLILSFKNELQWEPMRIFQLLIIAVVCAYIVQDSNFTLLLFAFWVLSIILLEPTINKPRIRKILGLNIDKIIIREKIITVFYNNDVQANININEITKLSIHRKIKTKYTKQNIVALRYYYREFEFCIETAKVPYFFRSKSHKDFHELTKFNNTILNIQKNINT